MPLQKEFSTTRLGHLRNRWFAHLMLACEVPGFRTKLEQSGGMIAIRL